MDNNNYNRIVFRLCCIALIVTSMTFAIRAGILGQLGGDFGLTDTELGWVNAMAFLGFPVATMLGGIIYNAIGAKKLVALAFICHLLGLALTITADGFWGLLVSTFLIGFANGSVEAGCNPLIAEMYPKNTTTMLNRFHVWFPGGIVIGALASNFMSAAGLKLAMASRLILVPTIIYGAMLIKAKFPTFDTRTHSTSSNIRHLFTPLYLFLIACMTFTATTEFGTQQWIERILGSSGASPMVVLALITGLMAVGRFFAGPIVHKLNPTGVLLSSALCASLGVFMMSQAQGTMIYLAAILFAIGVTYFLAYHAWLCCRIHSEIGALGMSLMGGAGMFAMSIWNPVIGSWIDSARLSAKASGASAEQIEILAGQAVLQNLLIFPIILIVAFIGLHLVINNNKRAEKCAS